MYFGGPPAPGVGVATSSNSLNDCILIPGKYVAEHTARTIKSSFTLSTLCTHSWLYIHLGKMHSEAKPFAPWWLAAGQVLNTFHCIQLKSYKYENTTPLIRNVVVLLMLQYSQGRVSLKTVLILVPEQYVFDSRTKIHCHYSTKLHLHIF